MTRMAKLAGRTIALGSRNGSELMAARSCEAQALFRGTQVRSIGRLPYAVPAMDVLAFGPADEDIVCTSSCPENDIDFSDGGVEKK